MNSAEKFNNSGFSRFINSPVGRLLRIAAGAAYLTFGYKHRGRRLGALAMAWSVVPLSAGLFDLCYLSAVLGGPLSGEKIREEMRPRPQNA